MDGILELDTEEQFEELRKLFPSAIAIEPTDWKNIWMIVGDGHENPIVRMNFGTCHGDIWPESSD